MEAVQRARSGGGPTLLELVTYRITGHSRRDPCNYQPKEERERALANEPIGRWAAHLTTKAGVAQEELGRIGAEVDALIEAAVKHAMAAPLPAPEAALQDLFVEEP